MGPASGCGGDPRAVAGPSRQRAAPAKAASGPTRVRPTRGPAPHTRRTARAWGIGGPALSCARVIWPFIRSPLGRHDAPALALGHRRWHRSSVASQLQKRETVELASMIQSIQTPDLGRLAARRHAERGASKHHKPRRLAGRSPLASSRAPRQTRDRTPGGCAASARAREGERGKEGEKGDSWLDGRGEAEGAREGRHRLAAIVGGAP